MLARKSRTPMSKTILSPEWWSRKNSDSSARACCTGPVSSRTGAVKGLARMRVRQTKSPQRNGLSRGLQQTRREQPADDPKENSSIHCEFLIPVNLFVTTVALVPPPVQRVTDP